MKFLLCQISLTALLFAQSPHEAKTKALCDAMQREYTYLADEPAETYLQSIVSRMGQATIRIVDEQEPWADYTPCRQVLITKGFLHKAASERELAETIAHMLAHSDQQLLARQGWFIRLHHPRALNPKTLTGRTQLLEAEANQRAAELLATFTPDPNSTGLKAFQQNDPLPVRKKPTLYR